MYSVDEIKEILGAFDKSKATKLNIKSADGEQLTITQKNEQVVVAAPNAAVTTTAETVVQPADARQTISPFIQHEETVQTDDGSAPVTSPMVGVFYAAPSPDKDP
ncbi:MAG: hypothetical protein II711_04055, partial [Clostridia bacterium]|nr:hypothetical protein [Clostridia bacterium]